MTDDERAREQVQEVEALLAAVDELDDAAGSTATAAVEALVDLYGSVLERVIGHVTHDPPGELLAVLAQDELVGHVLMAHGLLPAPPEFLEPPPPPVSASPGTAVPVAFVGRRTSVGGS